MKDLPPITLFPCHGMEDFPSHLDGDEAAQVLAAWTVAWHPNLIHQSGTLPTWQSTDFITQPLDGRILIAAPIAERRLCEEIRQLIEDEQATLVVGGATRNSYLNHPAIRQLLGNTPARTIWCEHFFALGYAFLQTRLVTQQLRYSTALDLDRFAELVVEAASVAVTTTEAPGDFESIRSTLQPCYDLLLEEKARYYPMPAQLLDVVIPAGAPTTAAAPTPNQTSAAPPTNVLVTGQQISKWSRSHPALLAAWAEGMQQDTWDVIGGVWDEVPQNFLPLGSALRQMTHGQRAISQPLGAVPALFGRRTFGMHPLLPSLLEHFGVAATVHASLGGGEVPSSGSPIINWQAADGSRILAIASTPLNAHDPGSLLGLGLTVGQMLDSAHHATQLLVRWSHRSSEFLQDLFNASRFGPIVGQWMTASQLVDLLYDPGFTETFVLDDYRSFWFADAVRRGWPSPVSRWIDHECAYRKYECARHLDAMTSMLGNPRHDQTPPATDGDGDALDHDLLALDRALVAHHAEPPEVGLDRYIQQGQHQLERALSDFANALGLEDVPADQAESVCLVNPLSFKRRVHLRVPAQTRLASRCRATPLLMVDASPQETIWLKTAASAPDSGSPPLPGSTQDDADTPTPPFADIVAEMPGFSFDHIPLLCHDEEPFQRQPAMVRDNRVRNEFFEIEIDESTGGVRRIESNRSKKNLGAQRLDWRFPDPNRNGRAGYGQMIADQISIHRPSHVSAEVHSQGSIVAGETVVARFRQRVLVVRGLRTIRFDVDLEPLVPWLDDGRSNYLCNRLAWPDTEAVIWRESMGQWHPTLEMQIDAPRLVDIRQNNGRLSFLGRGIAFHRRSDKRMLDSILIVRGESRRRFQWAIAVDSPQPILSQLADAAPTPHGWFRPNNTPSRSGWLIHVSRNNLVVADSRPHRDPQGRSCGVELVVQETIGQSGRARISTARPLAAAYTLNGRDELQTRLEIDENGAAAFDYAAHGFLRMVLNWQT